MTGSEWTTFDFCTGYIEVHWQVFWAGNSRFLNPVWFTEACRHLTQYHEHVSAVWNKLFRDYHSVELKLLRMQLVRWWVSFPGREIPTLYVYVSCVVKYWHWLVCRAGHQPKTSGFHYLDSSRNYLMNCTINTHSQQKSNILNFLKVVFCIVCICLYIMSTQPSEILEIIISFFQHAMTDASDTTAWIMSKPAEMMPLINVSNSSPAVAGLNVLP